MKGLKFYIANILLQKAWEYLIKGTFFTMKKNWAINCLCNKLKLTDFLSPKKYNST